ncbi:type IVB secretion system protein IcmJDotN [Piscirickettsia litoralis]|uniref:HNH endonuclease n=1 Tax=Piscirickettsia litoralis TaxID=1891921 RepID=A0ABX3A0U6_9GAMM|nr:type IVB secretion system protein IcmJDotN [Piscirickettsia litoralis]ODN42482.1 hypothetical protein BGC07_05505 [Piscirickettsia litoralis]
MLNLCLQACSGNFIRHERRKKNNRFKEISKKIAEEYSYKCRYCNMLCENWYDIVNIDGDYKNNKSSNLAIACKICSQCLLLDQYGVDYSGEDKLIYLPELNQVELNIIMVAMAEIACSTNNKSVDKDRVLSAKTVYSSLSERSELLSKIYQIDMSRPALFSFISNESLKASELVSSIRILFSLNKVSGLIS